MNPSLKFPFYAKAAFLLIGLYVFISMLSISQAIILPLIYSVIIAVLISPVINFLVKKKINRTFSISVVITTAILIGLVLVTMLGLQVSRLSDAWPQLTDKFQHLLDEAVAWASVNFNISEQKINDWIQNTKKELFTISSSSIGITLNSIGGLLVPVFLMPVYILMILYYQSHLLKFAHQLFSASNDNKVSEVLTETKTIIQSYLVGLFVEFIIVAILNSAGLLLLGIDYAILLGIIGALLNIIPYLGGIIGVVLFMIVALVTKTPVYVVYVIALYSVIQFIDNNYIVPKIIGSKVKLNALISLIAVIAGAALWGIPGMFLSIPLTAIFKLIFDRVESLKPWGFLLGDSIPPLNRLKKKSG